jgi:hypothetical protein
VLVSQLSQPRLASTSGQTPLELALQSPEAWGRNQMPGMCLVITTLETLFTCKKGLSVRSVPQPPSLIDLQYYIQDAEYCKTACLVSPSVCTHTPSHPMLQWRSMLVQRGQESGHLADHSTETIESRRPRQAGKQVLRGIRLLCISRWRFGAAPQKCRSR